MARSIKSKSPGPWTGRPEAAIRTYLSCAYFHHPCIFILPTANAYRYTVDGNATFLTAAEAAWRRATSPHYSGGGVVVAIGYPLKSRVFSPRRNLDLTPPSPRAPEGFGGADHLLDFIQYTLKPFVSSVVLPNTTIEREALYGHSFGGLFTLYTLFTRTWLFDCYIASSPSIHWDDFYIVGVEERFRQNAHDRQPSLMIFFGSYEQYPPRWADEDPEGYEKRRRGAEKRAMTDSANAMYGRLKNSELFACVTIKEYPIEDHGTVIACSLSRGLTTFLEEWPLRDERG